MTKSSPRKAGVALAIATALAVPAEGLRQFAYYDPPGILTVCYGHTGADVVAGKAYSLAECRGLLEKDMLESIADVERCAPGLPDHQLAAFADAVFNKARVAGVSVELPGLTKRRKAEYELCITNPAAAPSTDTGSTAPASGAGPNKED
jgi:GH24 family phage-related lysozyme (muramidase)